MFFDIESPNFMILDNAVPSLSVTAVMPLAGGQGRLKPTQNLGVQLILFQPGGQNVPTTLLITDLKF